MVPFPTVHGRSFDAWLKQFVAALEPLIVTLPKENQDRLAEASAALSVQLEKVLTQAYNDIEFLNARTGRFGDQSQEPIP